MESERFTVPEVLFHPSDIGINMAGLPEACEQSCQRLGQLERGLCTANILLTGEYNLWCCEYYWKKWYDLTFAGGSTMFAQFKDRFIHEIRPLIPDDCDINVHHPPNPQEYAWKGAYLYVDNLCRSNKASQVFITKAQYSECGSHYCNEKFFAGW